MYIYIYIYIYKSTPPDKKIGWRFGFESTVSVAGLQFLLPGRMAKIQVKGACFHRHRYVNEMLDYGLMVMIDRSIQ